MRESLEREKREFQCRERERGREERKNHAGCEEFYTELFFVKLLF